jgi:hypothetical protein
MQLNKAMFRDNGGCGFVLKPEILTNSFLDFDPNEPNKMNNKKVFEIKIISAQKLPRKDDIVKDISDPYGKMLIQYCLNLLK